MSPEAYRQLRKRAGLTQVQVAEILRCDPSTLSHRERGHARIDGEAEMAMRHLAHLVQEGKIKP